MTTKERCTITENMKKLLELVSGNNELAAKVGGGVEYSDGSVRCVCMIGGDGNW